MLLLCELSVLEGDFFLPLDPKAGEVLFRFFPPLPALVPLTPFVAAERGAGTSMSGERRRDEDASAFGKRTSCCGARLASKGVGGMRLISAPKPAALALLGTSAPSVMRLMSKLTLWRARRG